MHPRKSPGPPWSVKWTYARVRIGWKRDNLLPAPPAASRTIGKFQHVCYIRRKNSSFRLCSILEKKLLKNTSRIDPQNTRRKKMKIFPITNFWFMNSLINWRDVNRIGISSQLNIETENLSVCEKLNSPESEKFQSISRKMSLLLIRQRRRK